MALRPIGGLGFDKFLWAILTVDKLALAYMACFPYFVGDGTTLTFGVLESAAWVHTGVELASGLKVSELAALGRAVSAVATERHAGVFEMAVGVGAVREEATQFLSLVC